MSFGILCAAMLILVGGGAYALAAGVIAPAVNAAVEARATPEPTPTATPPVITPIPSPSFDPQDANLTTTTDPVTGEIVAVDPETLVTETPDRDRCGQEQGRYSQGRFLQNL